MRTSLSHPLYLDEIPVGSGAVGMTICPGKKGQSVYGADWDRDLDLDLAAIRDWGATAVLTLIEEREIEMLQVRGLSERVAAHGMEWIHFPIRDLEAPDARGLAHWSDLAPRLHRLLDEGKFVAIHCRGGLGRAGMMAALILIERGDSPSDAISRVRAVRKGAIETAAQERFLSGRPVPSGERARRVRASLFGGAIGDALGAKIEFRTLGDIRRAFPHGLLELPPHHGRVGVVTDDTQMTLFTAEGIIRAHVRQAEKGICSPPSVVHHALLRWLVTQGRRPQTGVDDLGLVADPRLHAQRAPGNTCLGALEAAQRFGTPAENTSKGCGTIMRVAPVAFSGASDVAQLAIATSALTHGHPTGQNAAGAWARLLEAVLAGHDLETTATALIDSFDDETAGALLAALEAPRDCRPETVETLGGGWVAEEALSIALYAALAGGDFEDGLRIAVMHSGDSDSTGAVAGNLLGLLYPERVMTHRWRQQIECPDLVNRLAHDLDFCLDHPAGELFDQYPGW